MNLSQYYSFCEFYGEIWWGSGAGTQDGWHKSGIAKRGWIFNLVGFLLIVVLKLILFTLYYPY